MSAQPTTATTTPPVAVGMLARLKLTEPVRLYMYTVLLVVEGGLVLAGWLTGDWVNYMATDAALLLAVPAGAEAARASVYSPAAAVRTVSRARQ